MGDKTEISWTDHTFNGWVGCAPVSPGCRFCYANTQTQRWNPGNDQWRRHGTRRITSDANWRKPLQWNRAAEKAGERRRVFASSLADVFEDRRDLDEPRARLFSLIGQTPWLDWLLLTKRADCMARLVPWAGQWPRNVWAGVSAEDQPRLDQRIDHLLAIPAAIRFLSCEPLLGPLRIRTALMVGMACDPPDGISWVIAGGESGRKARPMSPAWVRSLRDQCAEAGVPFHFKQAGEWTWTSPPGNGEPQHWISASDGRVADEATALAGGGDWTGIYRVGKHAAGRELDGEEWLQFPQSAMAVTR